jgi:hypothetical protein
MDEVKGIAKKISNDGGFMPDGTPVQGFAQRALKNIAEMKKDGYPSEVIAYYQQYVHDLVKGPSKGPTILSANTAQRIKSVEFLRTIGLNLGSAVQNGLQQINTFAKVTPGSFSKAYYDLFNPQIRKLAYHEGVASDVLAKADLDAMSSPTRLDAWLRSATGKAGYVFQKVEEMNRVHAFAAGLRDAEKMGLAGKAAIQYAKDIVNTTQFRFGIENAPTLLRGGNPTLSVLGQYKSYQIQQTLFLKNLVADTISGKDKFALWKYLGGAMAIAGPDAITGHHIGDFLRKQMSGVFGGDPKDYKFRGMLGALGVSLGQAIGLGALPVENMQSLAFLIPGPALSHIIDTASLFLNKNLTPQAATKGEFGKTLTPEQWSGMATRLGSVQLDKLRRAIRIWRSGGMLQDPINLGETWGKGSTDASRPIAPGEGMKTLLGFRGESTEEYGTARQEVSERQQRYQELVNKKAEAHAAGNYAEVDRLNKLGIAEFGAPPVIRSQNVKDAKIRQQVPALERSLRRTPKQIRQQIRKEAED